MRKNRVGQRLVLPDIKPKKTKAIKEVKLKEPREIRPSTIDIICVDCEAVRTIKPQDAFQVKRCVACQTEYRREQRRHYKKNQVGNLREEVKRLKEKCGEGETKEQE